MNSSTSPRAGSLRLPLIHRRGGSPSAAQASVVSATPWARIGLYSLLMLTAALYVWNLGASGWGNGFYSAAVEAGTKSWKAFFFGSFDSSNFITVDKPPAALWVMELSARVFGVNSWSILVPQALEGVAAVALLHATVRRQFGTSAGLIAGMVLALTPVAALMFRFNNPDALLVLLLVGSAYSTMRAVESGQTRWLLIAGMLVGFGFLAKMLQAFLVLPGYIGVYLAAGPVPLRRRFLQLTAAGGAVVLAAGWWVTIVALWPAADRPYIGGSQDNSILNLIFGYNGFGRITGNESGSVVGGGGTSGSMWGPTGITRLFNASFGGQISWLLPAALLLGATVVWLRGRAPRTDSRRAAALLWGAWLVVTGVTLSLAAGIIHPYYTVALAPAIGALVGMGAVTVWQQRTRLAVRLVGAAIVLATATWAYILLDRSSDWLIWLRYAIVGAAVLTSVAWIMAPRASGVVRMVVVTCLAAVALAGPAAYSIDTAVTAHAGAIPSAGPAVANAQGGPGGFGGPGGAGGPASARGNAGPGGTAVNGFGPPPGAGAGFMPPLGIFGQGGPGGTAPSGAAPSGAGGLLDASAPSAALTAKLGNNAANYQWVAATVGANSAAGYQLATNDAVLAIGGFNGTDPTPTLAAFETLVAQGKIHYFIAGGGGGPSGSSPSSSTAISTWVSGHFTSETVDGTTLYDLTRSTS